MIRAEEQEPPGGPGRAQAPARPPWRPRGLGLSPHGRPTAAAAAVGPEETEAEDSQRGPSRPAAAPHPHMRAPKDEILVDSLTRAAGGCQGAARDEKVKTVVGRDPRLTWTPPCLQTYFRVIFFFVGGFSGIQRPHPDWRSHYTTKNGLSTALPFIYALDSLTKNRIGYLIAILTIKHAQKQTAPVHLFLPHYLHDIRLSHQVDFSFTFNDCGHINIFVVVSQ